jgi:hypothetical protein
MTKINTSVNKRTSKCKNSCSLKHLKSVHTFTNKSLQAVLADFEQQFIPEVAITCPV